jgi:hypothetical protein
MSSQALAELLEQRRAALEALPGVVGTAVGAGVGGTGSDVEAIHLYVTREADAGRLCSEADRLLEGAPFALIEMEVPEAQSD